MSESQLTGAVGIINSGERQIEAFGSKKGDGVWKVKKNKIGISEHVPQDDESREKAEQVITLIKDFEKFWSFTLSNLDQNNKYQELNPNKRMVREMFVKMQELEDNLNKLLIKYPKAFKAWFDFKIFTTSLNSESIKTRVLEKEKIDTIWERAIEQIDGKKNRSEYFYGNTKKEGGSWVLDGLSRIKKIRNITRIDTTHFNPDSQFEKNYRIFVKFIEEEEKNWGGEILKIKLSKFNKIPTYNK